MDDGYTLVGIKGNKETVAVVDIYTFSYKIIKINDLPDKYKDLANNLINSNTDGTILFKISNTDCYAYISELLNGSKFTINYTIGKVDNKWSKYQNTVQEVSIDKVIYKNSQKTRKKFIIRHRESRGSKLISLETFQEYLNNQTCLLKKTEEESNEENSIKDKEEYNGIKNISTIQENKEKKSIQEEKKSMQEEKKSMQEKEINIDLNQQIPCSELFSLINTKLNKLLGKEKQLSDKEKQLKDLEKKLTEQQKEVEKQLEELNELIEFNSRKIINIDETIAVRTKRPVEVEHDELAYEIALKSLDTGGRIILPFSYYRKLAIYLKKILYTNRLFTITKALAEIKFEKESEKHIFAYVTTDDSEEKAVITIIKKYGEYEIKENDIIEQSRVYEKERKAASIIYT